jgi:hypothetical protein
MGRNHLCEQAIPKDPAHLLSGTCAPDSPSGLSLGFPRLFPSRRQLDYVLLARPPRYSPCGFHVRLACLIHAANVRSEPGSNPSLGMFVLSVASPCATSPKARYQGGLPACPADLPTSGHQALIKSSHAFFSRPPRMSKIVSHSARRWRARGGRR